MNRATVRPSLYDAERLMRRNVYGAGGLLALVAVFWFFLFFLRADFTWSMFMVIGLVAILFIAISMSYAPRATLIGLVFLKPLIDQLWWFRAFGGLNFQALVGSIVPVMAFTFLFLTRNEFFLRAPMSVWVRRMILLTFLTLYVQGFSMGKLAETFRIISGPALFFLTGWLFTQSNHFKQLTKAVIWSGVWILLGIWVSYMIGKERFTFDTFGDNPLEGMYYHKHDLARISMMVCIFSLCFIKMTASKAARFFCYVMAVVMGFIVFTSYTRASWIALFFCVCFWYIWMGKWKWVVVIGPLVLILSWSILEKAFAGAHVDLANPDLTDPKSLSGRREIWAAQVKGFVNSNPVDMLLGGGFGRSNYYTGVYANIGRGRDAHSSLPLMIVENGLIFTVIYNTLIILLCRDAWRLRKSTDPTLQILGALFFVGVAYFYISGITTNSHTYPSLTWYIWGLGGMIYRMVHFPVTEEQEQARRKTHYFSRSFAPVTLVRPQS